MGSSTVQRAAAAVVSTLALAGALGAGPAEAAETDETPATEAPSSEAPAETAVAVPVPEPSEAPDNMRYPPSSVRVGLIAGGIGILGLAYGLTALCANTWPEVPGSDVMYVPVVGPWGALVQSGCSSDDPDCGAMLVLRTILLVLDGFAQAGGSGLIGEGIFMTTEADSPAAPDSAHWMVTPIVAPGQAGLGVMGTF